jgi:cytosine/adenosine deaminase-related metal-dependent hydrolase
MNQPQSYFFCSFIVHLLSMSSFTLYRAPYLFDGISPGLLRNAWVIMDEQGFVVEVGTGSSPHGLYTVDCSDLLCPGFINSHCHTELSYLQGRISSGIGLQLFLEGIEKERNHGREHAARAAAEAIEAMYRSGIVFVGDICNTLDTLEASAGSTMQFYHFVEVFGFMPSAASKVFAAGLEKWKQWGSQAGITFHATYSLSNELLAAINRHALEEDGLLSIHNQESEEENQLYINGSGKLAERLLSWGMNLDHWQTGHKSSLMGLLPKITRERPLMLVHNTVTTEEEVRWAMQHHPQLYWCLCPGANQYISNRLPEARVFFESGARVLLGTDSLSSNWQLNMVHEMFLLQEGCGIALPSLLLAATKNAATFFNCSQLGSLSKGNRPGLVQITSLSANAELTAQSESILLRGSI